MQMSWKKLVSPIVFLTTAWLTGPVSAQVQNSLYLVYLNPFSAQELEEEELKNGHVPLEVPSVLRGEARAKFITVNLEALQYRPGLERLKKIVTNEIVGREIGKTVPTIPAFYAYLNEDEVKALRSSDYVVSIEILDDNEVKPVFSSHSGSPYTDSTSGAETIPWGKVATETNDGVTSSRGFYIVDDQYSGTNTNTSPEINLQYTNTPTGGTGYHSTMVLSVAAAKSNNSKTRGINPGQPIYHFSTDIANSVEVINNINAAAEMAEWNDEFSTLNLSFNQPSGPNPFASGEVFGKAIRRASSRLLVVQSAGNQDSDACNHAYNHNSAAIDGGRHYRGWRIRSQSKSILSNLHGTTL